MPDDIFAGDYEILGDELLLTGEDDDLMMGDDSIKISNRAREMAAAKILGRNSLLLKPTRPTKARVFPLGFISDGPVPPSGSVTIISRPQVVYRGDRLVVPSDIAGEFQIDDVKVGKDSQLVAEGPLPARCLQENAVAVSFQMDTAQISQDISISVTNTSGAARIFRAMIVGNAAE